MGTSGVEECACTTENQLDDLGVFEKTARKTKAELRRLVQSIEGVLIQLDLESAKVLGQLGGRPRVRACR